MKKLDDIYFCSNDLYLPKCSDLKECKHCANRHHLFPTPEQFKEEYGFDVPEDMPVWYIDSDDPEDEWILETYCVAVRYKRSGRRIVVACTPFIPSNSWRPEVTK